MQKHLTRGIFYRYRGIRSIQFPVRNLRVQRWFIQRQLCLFRWWWWSIWMEIMRSCVHTRRRPSASLRYPPRLPLNAALLAGSRHYWNNCIRMVSSFRGISPIFRLDRYRDIEMRSKVIRVCFICLGKTGALSMKKIVKKSCSSCSSKLFEDR